MESLEQGIQSWIGTQAIWIAGLVMVFVFRRFIESAVSGFLVFVGNDYNADDIVYLNGRPGRIVRVGFTKTVFFLYNVKNNLYTGEAYISGGSKLVVQNSALAEMQIEKPLENVDLSRYILEAPKKDQRENEDER